MNLAVRMFAVPEKPKNSEVRCAVRFPLRLPIRIVTEQGEFDAVTENISASGILFELDELLPVDTVVGFLMRMPAQAFGSKEDVVVQCAGRIVRSYKSSPGNHAAAVIDDYRFSQ
jgi:hypothetical protein